MQQRHALKPDAKSYFILSAAAISQCLHRSEGHCKHNEMCRQHRRAQMNCSKPVVRSRDFYYLLLLETGSNDTHPNHKLLIIYNIAKNLYKLAGESGSQIATAHSWLTRRLAQTLSNFGCASGTFRISSSPRKWRSVPYMKIKMLRHTGHWNKLLLQFFRT